MLFQAREEELGERSHAAVVVAAGGHGVAGSDPAEPGVGGGVMTVVAQLEHLGPARQAGPSFHRTKLEMQGFGIKQYEAEVD